MSSLSLLVFTRNDVAGAVETFRKAAGPFDETVLIDSSDPSAFEPARADLERLGVTVHRVVPVGYVDLVRPYGICHVRSDRVLILDADERISARLRAELPRRIECDGYRVPRWEASVRALSYHLRLFRPARARIHPRSWDYPRIEGSLGVLPREATIEHRAPHAGYLAREDRARRYLPVESFERPFTREYAAAAVPTLFPAPTSAHADDLLPRAATRLIIELEGLGALLVSGRLGYAKFHRGYALEKLAYLDRIGPEEVARRIGIHAEIRAAGGLVRYLGFDDPAYVDRLTAAFGWDQDGPSVLRSLIEARHRDGSPTEVIPGPASRA